MIIILKQTAKQEDIAALRGALEGSGPVHSRLEGHRNPHFGLNRRHLLRGCKCTSRE